MNAKAPLSVAQYNGDQREVMMWLMWLHLRLKLLWPHLQKTQGTEMTFQDQHRRVLCVVWEHLTAQWNQWVLGWGSQIKGHWRVLHFSLVMEICWQLQLILWLFCYSVKWNRLVKLGAFLETYCKGFLKANLTFIGVSRLLLQDYSCRV